MFSILINGWEAEILINGKNLVTGREDTVSK
jgi:hypothetical protein